MKLYISYFYQIRYFKPYQIPLSTAKWDPKWYHNNTQDKLYLFKDSNEVYNGFRIEDFVPDSSCEGLCSGIKNCETKIPWTCEFLKTYRKQLETIDYNKLIENLEGFSEQLKRVNPDFEKDPEIIFIVYEAPDNHCSEREAIQDWFKAHGYELKEWRRGQ